jgi:hypothetical protein
MVLKLFDEVFQPKILGGSTIISDLANQTVESMRASLFGPPDDRDEPWKARSQ